MQGCALNDFLGVSQRARLYAAASQRRSVRTFCAPPDVAQLSALHYTAAKACLPGVRIVIGECDEEKLFLNIPIVGAVVGTNRYAAVIADMSAPHAALYAGASGEMLVLEAVSLGLGTCWLGFFRRSAVDIALSPNERVLAIIALGIAAEEDIRERKRKPLSEICSSDPALWPIYAFNAAECVRAAPSAMNRQPWKLAYAGRTVMLSRKKLGGDLDMGIALLHLTLGAGERAHILRLGEGREVATLIAEEEHDAV